MSFNFQQATRVAKSIFDQIVQAVDRQIEMRSLPQQLNQYWQPFLYQLEADSLDRSYKPDEQPLLTSAPHQKFAYSNCAVRQADLPEGNELLSHTIKINGESRVVRMKTEIDSQLKARKPRLLPSDAVHSITLLPRPNSTAHIRSRLLTQFNTKG